MKQDPPADFADTKPQGPASLPVAPLNASWPTRILYCLALLALVMSSLGQASSWVGLAIGGGLIAWAGPSTFLLMTAALIYRVYRVLRYRQALDARPPNVFGQLLRGLGWLLMLAGTIGAVSMVLVRPLTLMIFKTGGEAGVAFFVVGLYATMVASVGWVGCLLFEISRALGKRVSPPAAPRTRRQRLQDGGVFAGLVAMALAWPFLDRVTGGEPCWGKTLGACVAKVNGGVTRMAMAPVGAPVMLQSNLEAIEFRHTGGQGWTLTEKPAVSLLRSGHPAAAAGVLGDVGVLIDAAESDGGVLITLVVTEKGQEAASFSTRFKSGARLEPGAAGKRKLVVDVPRNVQSIGRREELLDEIYRQIRISIGSEREVAEAGMQVRQTATLLTSSAVAERADIGDARPGKGCKDILKFERGKAEADLRTSGFLPQMVFVQQPVPSPSVLLLGNDRVGCHGEAVWVASDVPAVAQLRIRKFNMAGALQRHLLVTMPERKALESTYADEASFSEREGQLEFDVFVSQGPGNYKRERFGVKL